MMASSIDAVTACEARIIKQIEYYFSDINLLKDKFLQEKIQEDDGWVTIDTMLKFNRLKEITDNAQTICEALKKSSSGLMEVSEQGDKIRRSPFKPLPDDTKERRDEIIARTVYARPFPVDVKLDDVQEFFEGYGELDEVIMIKDCQTKAFRGSVFATFANKENAAKFVIEEETKFREQDLKVKCFKTNYLNDKAAKREAKFKGMIKNAVLHLKGLSYKISKEQVKAFFSNVLQSDVAWVDFVKGGSEGYIRLREPDSADSTLEKVKAVNEGKIVIHGSEIEVRVVEGNEELKYLKMIKNIMKRPQRKRKQNKEDASSDAEAQDTEEPPAKVIKSEMINFDKVMSFEVAL
ncbi:hypothetical protein BsWGS_00833 [Bradybaena similaris]